jgi:hypothetical protein
MPRNTKTLAPADWDHDQLNAALGGFSKWHHNCHAASLQLVRSGVLPDTARVARGTCPGVGGQHSWVVVDGDCYDRSARIIDPTLWSYDPTVPGIWTGRASERPHVPHGGIGSIWTWGRPVAQGGPIVELTPATPLSVEARQFVELIGPLDRAGWQMLIGYAPVDGWPAAELIAAADDTAELSVLVPIDRLGMLTDRNPDGLYR